MRIVASSGFGAAKCRVMARRQGADRRGRHRQLHPERWHETYATADIVEYDGKPMVKVGREFLLRLRPDGSARSGPDTMAGSGI